MNKVQKRQRNTTVIRPFPRRARACECPCPESPHFMDILNTGDMYRFSPQGQSHTEPSGADWLEIQLDGSAPASMEDISRRGHQHILKVTVWIMVDIVLQKL